MVIFHMVSHVRFNYLSSCDWLKYFCNFLVRENSYQMRRLFKFITNLITLTCVKIPWANACALNKKERSYYWILNAWRDCKAKHHIHNSYSAVSWPILLLIILLQPRYIINKLNWIHHWDRNPLSELIAEALVLLHLLLDLGSLIFGRTCSSFWSFYSAEYVPHCHICSQISLEISFLAILFFLL